MLRFIFVITICRLPSNNSDPMGDHMPPPNAWRPIHQPNTGPSFNAGFHGMGPPLIPRSGDMALPINAVSINSMILKYVFPSQMIIFFFKSYHHRKCFSQSVGFAFKMDLLLHGD
jgi:hypothetical protein